MGLKRRDFLQRAGWALAALGVSEAGLLRLGVSDALALSTHRYTGLAAKELLVGNDGTGSLQVGLQEAVRVLPRNISLSIALGAGLERIERVDATSAFATIPHVSLVIAGEQPADYLFGRVQEAKT